MRVRESESVHVCLCVSECVLYVVVGRGGIKDVSTMHSKLGFDIRGRKHCGMLRVGVFLCA